jgi:hypothetical protein
LLCFLPESSNLCMRSTQNLTDSSYTFFILGWSSTSSIRKLTPWSQFDESVWDVIYGQRLKGSNAKFKTRGLLLFLNEEIYYYTCKIHV